ncbi:hypothetical protein [Paenibacillus beijingensis]|uniref:Uncharacterized protein n=1 Tax=Paenibacillus beijingensis TaxID=1126833 RepID=A0A0D5NMT1_9BACL|nr:hypothetical protein [Paenibacillus beijingensis]AJY76591.1 hypothetical protein VN24_20975 [Paenibacillus beijingensis]
MIGTWRWNVSIGLVGFIFTCLVSIAKNPLPVTGLRGIYAFIAFFAFGYVIRLMARLTISVPDRVQRTDAAPDQSGKGEHLDYVTPDNGEDLNELLRSGLSGKDDTARAQPGAFKPLKPPHLVSTARSKNPQELAEAVRHWNNQEE